MPSIDPAILKALSISPSTAKLSSHGGSGFASTNRLTTPTTSYFIKTSSSPGAETMFAGEHHSLNAIHSAVPSLCPKSFAHGPLDSGGGGGYFLATEFLELGLSRTRSNSSGAGSGLSLAEKLAKLHTTPAPTPAGHSKPVFGFPVSTCCGDTPQTNEYRESWAEFFGECRLMAILRRCEEQQGRDRALRETVERAVKEVVPRLLADGHLGGEEGIRPVVVHGDLWSGNKGKGSFVGREGDEAGVEEVVFDPSACWAHSEFELGIMQMFGGFGGSFMRTYHEIKPRDTPVEEYDDRVSLYQAYHHLNHHAIFGGYKGGAMNILKGLLKKYGDK